MEYQQQAEFEYEIRMQGAERVSFPTIAGSGMNGCMRIMVRTNASWRTASCCCSTSARAWTDTAPISRAPTRSTESIPRARSRFTTSCCAQTAKSPRPRGPGVTLRELNDLCKKVLAEGLTAIGKIQSADEIGRYYMHGVSHHLGIDTHDCAVREDLGLRAGMVISDEPGLYIDE